MLMCIGHRTVEVEWSFGLKTRTLTVWPVVIGIHSIVYGFLKIKGTVFIKEVRKSIGCNNSSLHLYCHGRFQVKMASIAGRNQRRRSRRIEELMTSGSSEELRKPERNDLTSSLV
jgi:hypothetical protein